MDAFSIGTAGSWKVAADGLSPTHAYLYYDGATLFVASAPGALVTVRGRAVTTEWQALTPPVELSLGSLSLHVRSVGAVVPPPSRAPTSGTEMINAPGGGAAGTAGAAQGPASPRRPSVPKQPPAAGSPPEAGTAAPQRLGGMTLNMGQSPAANLKPEPEPEPDLPELEPYDDDDAPTAYQPIPEGFLGDGEDATRVIDDVPPVQAGGPSGQQQPGPSGQEQPQQQPAAPLERPSPPSNSPESGGDATVIRPLEEYLAQAGMAVPADLAQNEEQRFAPVPAAGRRAEPIGAAQGVFIQPPEPTLPPGGEAYWQQQQQAGQMPGQPYPGMPGQMAPGQMPPGMQPGQMPPGMQPGQMPPGMQPGQMMPGQMPGPPPNESPLDKSIRETKEWWQAAPLPRKIMVFLAPVALVAFYMIFFVEPAPRPRPKKPAASASGSVAVPPSSSAPEVAVPDTPESDAGETPENTGVAPTATAEAPDEEDAGPVKLKPGEVTLARKAADAVASGNHEEALEHYEELEKLTTDPIKKDAYKAAADILRRRIASQKQ